MKMGKQPPFKLNLEIMLLTDKNDELNIQRLILPVMNDFLER